MIERVLQLATIGAIVFVGVQIKELSNAVSWKDDMRVRVLLSDPISVSFSEDAVPVEGAIGVTLLHSPELDVKLRRSALE